MDKRISKVKPRDYELKPLPPHIHIPKEAHGQLEWIFAPPRLTRKHSELTTTPDGKKVITYKTTSGDFIQLYLFTQSIVGVNTPPLQEMRRAFMTSLAYALETGSWTTPPFTIKQKMRDQGYPPHQIKAGRIYQIKKVAERALADARFRRWNKKRGKAKEEEIGSLYSHLHIRGEGKGTTYQATINHELFPGLDIETRLVEGQYVTLPITDEFTLLSQYERNWKNHLVTLKGRPISIPFTGRKILQKAGLDKKYFHRKKLCLDIGLKCLSLADKEGFTRDKPDYAGDASNFTKWKLILYPPKIKPKGLTSSAIELAEEMAQWQRRDANLPKLSYDDYLHRWKRQIHKHGEETIRSLFKKEINSYRPSTKHLWDQVKRLSSLS